MITLFLSQGDFCATAHRVKHALCDIDSEDVHLLLHGTRLLWLYGFTVRELIVAHRSRSVQERVHFITTGHLVPTSMPPYRALMTGSMRTLTRSRPSALPVAPRWRPPMRA
jgi:hypothetical protein